MKITSETSKSFSLYQNYPNPFNPSTIINYRVTGSGLVNISVYNILGKSIATLVNQEISGGDHKVVWNGKDISGNDVPSGIYIYSIRAGNLVQVKKMVLSKIKY